MTAFAIPSSLQIAMPDLQTVGGVSAHSVSSAADLPDICLPIPLSCPGTSCLPALLPRPVLFREYPVLRDRLYEPPDDTPLQLNELPSQLNEFIRPPAALPAEITDSAAPDSWFAVTCRICTADRARASVANVTPCGDPPDTE